ncbi:MAG TPA: tetratricopeptide repeat protein [Pseudomonadaceae bacterium]|nr:tetratricopeptide repeat protein [Pseudomonadaceae bacterium]
MKYIVVALFTCLPLSSAVALELQLQPPRAEWMLQAVSPPLLQREGTALVTEQVPVQELVAFIGQQQYAQALDFMRSDFSGIIDLVESGDVDAQLRNRVVAGGFMPNVQRNQVSASLMYLLGHVYMELEQYAAAETAFKSALVPLPDYIRVHESLGLMYLLNERFADARIHLSRAASLGLNTSNLYGALGYLNQQSNNFWGAIAAYQQAMVMDPDNRQWQQGLLFALAQTYQFRSGLTLVEQMLQDEPDDPTLWMYRAQMSLQAEEREQALSSLETAIRLGEASLANLQVGATLHLELGSIGRAVELLDAGLEEGMQYRFVDQAVGWLIRMGEWEQTQRLLAGVEGNLSLDDTERSQLLTRQASVSLNSNAQQAARTALQQAVELDPANAEALMRLADIHRENRNYNQAELLYQRASADSMFRENAFVLMAQLAVDQDNPERALQLLRDVVRNNPGRSDLGRNINSLGNLVLLRQ